MLRGLKRKQLLHPRRPACAVPPGMYARTKEGSGKVFPRITNGKIYLSFGGELEDGTMIDGMYELPPEDPSYDVIKAWLIQVERGEWSLPWPSGSRRDPTGPPTNLPSIAARVTGWWSPTIRACWSPVGNATTTEAISWCGS
jgi:hypothetical protein